MSSFIKTGEKWRIATREERKKMINYKPPFYGILKLVVFSFLLLSIKNVQGQNLPRVKVDSLKKLLERRQPDTTRMNAYLQLAQFNVWKPDALKADMDSARHYIDDAVKLNARLRSLNYFGCIQYIRSLMLSEVNEPQQARAALDQAISALNTVRNHKKLGEAYFAKSFYFERGKRPIWIEHALAEYTKAKEVKLQGDCLVLLADLNSINTGSSEKTVALLNSATKKYNEINYKNTTTINVLYARNYLNKGFYTQGLKSLMLSLKTAESVNDRSQLCEIYYMIAESYYNLRENEKAAMYAKKSLFVAMDNNSSYDVYQVLLEVTETYIAAGHPDSALAIQLNVQKRFPVLKDSYYQLIDGIIKITSYVALKRYNEGERYFKRLIALATQPNVNKYILPDVYFVTTQYCLASGQYDKAAELFKKYDASAPTFKVKLFEVETYNARITLDTARKDYKTATKHLFTLIKIKDSTYNAAKNKQFEELQLGYQSEKKSNEIKLSNQKIMVLTQEQKLQKANLQKATLIRNITVIAIVLLIVVGGFFLKQYRQRQYASRIIERKNNQLVHLLSEKEWLLKEVHHRVKNNLHTVMCLLESQAEYLQSDALAAIENSKHRIYAMSLIHQKLYQTADVKAIDMDVYLPEFINYLEDSFSNTNRICFALTVDPIRVDVAHAVPIALIINEAVTNAIKYAFPDNRVGQITVSLLHTGEFIILKIADNGIGIPPETINRSFGSLGLKLIYGLSNEIKATISITNNKGTVIDISFPAKSELGDLDFMQEISERGSVFES